MERNVANSNSQILPLTPEIRGGLLGLVELVRLIPDHLIVDTDALTQITLSIEHIRTTVRESEQRQLRDSALAGETRLRPFVYPGGDSPTGGVNPVIAIRRALERCPDEAPAAGPGALSFIQDTELCQMLDTDIQSVRTALKNAEWKAATVLSGSVVEALLLWAIRLASVGPFPAASNAVASGRLARKPHSDVNKWHVLDYVEVAFELQIVTEQTAKQARLLSSFRNLIHPGRAARTGEKCTEGTAHGAVAAVNLVRDDLEQYVTRTLAKPCP